MKIVSLFITLLLLNSSLLFAQIGINPDGSAPDESAALDIAYTTRGFLPPRMTHEELDAISNPADGLVVYCNDCGPDGLGALSMFMAGKWYTLSANCLNPLAPVAGNHVPSPTQIVWKWNPVSYATGYRWNTVNDYGSATDMGTDILKTETGLIYGTSYTRYAWAYNVCGYSTPLTMSQLTISFTCTDSITINHLAGFVAPVTKTVTYGTVTSIPGETSKCWITSNLGSDHQATTANDATEASAGWYWQFNRMQGYKHDGTTRTPNSTWITSIDENSDWLAANDPCTLEFGNGWRLPTSTEWTNVDAGGSWTYWAGPWNSDLKLHKAGSLTGSDGSINDRGYFGNYLSNSQYNNTFGWYFFFASDICGVYSNREKVYAFSSRCLRAGSITPIVTTASVTNITQSTATGGGDVTGEGDAPVTARGVCWSTSTMPATADDHTNDGSGTGTFESSLTGLSSNTLYYVRAYATSSVGTSYGDEVSFSTLWACGDSITVNHIAGNIAPVSKTVTYGTVTNIPGETSKCWITSNLGSDHQATGPYDATEASAGWYWQFNRQQGYKHDGTNRIPSSTWITSIDENSGWLAANDPCNLELGNGWRLPTYIEWLNVDASGGWYWWPDPWNSALKIHASGGLSATNGSVNARGSAGFFWSSLQYSVTNGRYLDVTYDHCAMTDASKVNGFTIRCIRP
jgi:hypothetical protein